MGVPILKALAPLPKIESHKNAVFVGPHPDDIEIGAGGTAATLVRLGARVTFVVCTDGGGGAFDDAVDPSTLVARRHEEALRGASVLGVADVRFLGFPDCGKYDAWELAKKLAEIFADVSPDIVFAPDPRLPSEIHPDHVKCGEAVQTAVVFSGFPLIMERNGIPFDKEKKVEPRKTLAFYYTHRANRIVGMDAAAHRLKIAAMNAHESQFPADAGDERRLMKAYLDLRGRRFGRRVLKPFGEGFFVLGPLHQHAFPEVQDY